MTDDAPTEDSSQPKSGYFVVKRFEELYREFAKKPNFHLSIYALPLQGTNPDHVSVRYRGLNRDAIASYEKGFLAEIRFHELERASVIDVCDDLIPTHELATEILAWAELEFPGVYEIVWARIYGSGVEPPAGFAPLGFEPTYFVGNHFSALCDCMCFPRWHGTDPEGVLFRPWFERLNAYGLFNEASTASEFLDYLSFDWTETGDYEIAEVWGSSDAR